MPDETLVVAARAGRLGEVWEYRWSPRQYLFVETLSIHMSERRENVPKRAHLVDGPPQLGLPQQLQQL